MKKHLPTVNKIYHARPPLPGAQSRRFHAALVALTTAAYVCGFYYLYAAGIDAYAIPGVLPVLAASWGFGLRAGIAAALATFPINTLLLNLLGERGLSAFWDKQASLIGTAVIIFIGLIVAHMRLLSIRLSQELQARRQSEEQLHYSVSYLENLIEQSVECIVVTDAGGHITRANSAFQKLVGYREEEMLGNPLTMFNPAPGKCYATTSGEQVTIGPDFFQDQERNIAKLFLDGAVTGWHAHFLRKDGLLVPIDQNLALNKDSAGNPVGSLGTIRDITERRKAEAVIKQHREHLDELVREQTTALTETNRKLQQQIEKHLKTEAELRDTRDSLNNIIEGSLDAIAIADNTGHILKANRAFLKMTGYALEELIGKPLYVFSITVPGTYETTDGQTLSIDERYFAEAQQKIDQLFRSGSIAGWEAYFMRKDSVLVPVSQNIVFIYNDRGVATGSVGIMREISDKLHC